MNRTRPRDLFPVAHCMAVSVVSIAPAEPVPSAAFIASVVTKVFP